MQEIVEIGRATQDELRDDLRELFQGAIRLTLEMVLEEELKAMVGARRFERVGSRKDHKERHIPEAAADEPGADRGRHAPEPGQRFAGRRDRPLPAQEPRARRDDGRGVCERRVTAQDGRRHRGADGRACWALDGESCGKTARRGRGRAAPCADRGASPLSVPGRHVLGRPLGPQSRERECARGVCSGP